MAAASIIEEPACFKADQVKGRYIWDERNGKHRIALSLAGTDAHILEGLSECVDARGKTIGNMIENILR
jgi:hypothetical protein